MNQTDRISVSPITKPENFWKTLKLYLDKPHTVNKRLAGSVPLSYFKSTNEISLKNFIELKKHLKNEREYNGDSVINFLKENNIDAVKCPGAFLENLTSVPERRDDVLDGNKIIILRRLLPKNKNLYGIANELVLIGKFHKAKFSPNFTETIKVLFSVRFYNQMYKFYNGGCYRRGIAILL